MILCNKKIFVLAVTALLSLQTLKAYVPAGYYAAVNGKKSVELKAALSGIISPHQLLGYDALWEYYYLTYTHPDDRSRVLDMYSDNLYYFNSTLAVIGMNKEHCVPKSWWEGGQTIAPGYDLYNVIPSDATANNHKSNSPMGTVQKPTWSNGVITIGTGTANGKDMTFFEPCDKYKGDFARIYFYMATCYPDLTWLADKGSYMSEKLPLTIEDWILPTLINWNLSDPVDAEEIMRNENIAAIQHNRNPFVDYPELVDYIWGSKSAEQFLLADHKANETAKSVFHAATPQFSVIGGTEVEPREVPLGTELIISAATSRSALHLRVSGGEWKVIQPVYEYNPYVKDYVYVTARDVVVVDGTMTIDAYCTLDEREPSETLSYSYKTINYDDLYAFYEDFTSVTGGNNISTSGSSGKWQGNDNFPAEWLSSVYAAGGAVRLGTGSATGTLTTRPISISSETAAVDIDVKGWSSVEGQLKIGLSGCDEQTVTYNAKMTDDFETKTVSFTGYSPMPQLTISTTSKRAFIGSVKVYDSSTSVIEKHVTTECSNLYYSLSGQRLLNAPSAPGIYIHNGRKVIIR